MEDFVYLSFKQFVLSAIELYDKDELSKEELITSIVDTSFDILEFVKKGM